jgi:hypothetical protein
VGRIHDNFNSCWQLRMSIVGQPDKMLTDVTNSKGSRQLSAMSTEIQDSVHNLSNSVCTLHVGVLSQGTRNSSVTLSLPPKLTLLTEGTISSRLVILLLNP